MLGGRVGRSEPAVLRRPSGRPSWTAPSSSPPRGLTIRPCLAAVTEGTTGAALLAAENLLRPVALQLWLADGTPVPAAERPPERRLTPGAAGLLVMGSRGSG